MNEKVEKSKKIKKERVKAPHKTMRERMENHPRARKIINIVFGVICVLLVLTAIDIICVGKFNKGPFFALPLISYEEGGKGYIGFGYKVIKYDQDGGKKTTEIGTWFKKYDSSYLQVDLLDLALQYRNYPKNTYETYMGKFTQINGSVKTVDNQNKVLTLAYEDPDGAYTTELIVNMYDKDVDLSVYKVGDVVSVIGNISKMKSKVGTTPSQITLDNGFIFIQE